MVVVTSSANVSRRVQYAALLGRWPLHDNTNIIYANTDTNTAIIANSNSAYCCNSVCTVHRAPCVYVVCRVCVW